MNQTKNRLLNRILALEDQFGSRSPEFSKVVKSMRKQVDAVSDDLGKEEIEAITTIVEGACDMLDQYTDASPQVNQMMTDMREFLENPESHPELRVVEQQANLVAMIASLKFAVALMDMVSLWTEYQDQDQDQGEGLQHFTNFLEQLLGQLKPAAIDAGDYLVSLNIKGKKEAVFMINVLASSAENARKDIPSG